MLITLVALISCLVRLFRLALHRTQYPYRRLGEPKAPGFRSQPKPVWVRQEVIRLKALMSEARKNAKPRPVPKNLIWGLDLTGKIPLDGATHAFSGFWNMPAAQPCGLKRFRANTPGHNFRVACTKCNLKKGKGYKHANIERAICLLREYLEAPPGRVYVQR